MNETSEILIAVMTIAPLAAFFVFFWVCFCKFLEGQKLLYLYVKSFKQDLSWPLDDKLTKRYRTSSRIFAFYLYGTCRTNDKHLESLRVCNLVNEFRLAVLHTVILLVFAASCVSVFSLVLLVGDSSSSGKITGCAYSLTLLLIAKLYFSRFIKRRLLFYRKLLLFLGISVGELCKKMFFQFSVVYAIIGILVVLVMMPRNRKETEAAILVQPGTKLQWQPIVPPNNHSLSQKVSVAERPLTKIDVPRTDVSAFAAITDFTDNNRGGDDGETFSKLNQLMDELLALPVIPADYGETMVALYRDKVQDEITRDFAVQHIGLYAQALNRSGAYDPDSDDARQCRTALLDAAGETRTIIAAAAFRALSDVSAFDPHIDGKRLDAMLVPCASDTEAAPAARVMAAQLCGERGVVSSRAMLEEVLSDAAAPAPLRRAAKWSLSRLSGDSP